MMPRAWTVAVVVNVPVLECECTEQSHVDIIETSACREGGQVDFIVSVLGVRVEVRDNRVFTTRTKYAVFLICSVSKYASIFVGYAGIHGKEETLMNSGLPACQGLCFNRSLLALLVV